MEINSFGRMIVFLVLPPNLRVPLFNACTITLPVAVIILQTEHVQEHSDVFHMPVPSLCRD